MIIWLIPVWFFTVTPVLPPIPVSHEPLPARVWRA